MMSLLRQWRINAERYAAGARTMLRQMLQREIAIACGGLTAGAIITVGAVTFASRMADTPGQQTKRQAQAIGSYHAANPVPTEMQAASTDGSASRDDNPAATAPRTEEIKVVGAAHNPDVPCDEQTWPYIDRRCLTEAAPKQAAHANSEIESQPSPLNATAPVEPKVDDASLQADRAAETAPRSQPANAAQPSRQASKADAVATREALPVVEEEGRKPDRNASDDRTKKADIRDAKKATRISRGEKRAAARKEAKARDNDAWEETAPAQMSRADRRARAQARIVSRWRETVYDYPDGSRRRVIMRTDGEDDD
jgi:hypothetical protein